MISAQLVRTCSGRSCRSAGPILFECGRSAANASRACAAAPGADAVMAGDTLQDAHRLRADRIVQRDHVVALSAVTVS